MNQSLKYITRMDRGPRQSWRVRIGHLGLCRHFTDKLHGGREQALDAAVKCRDKALAAAGLPLTERVVVTRSPRNTSGVIGVSADRREGCFRVAAIGRGKAIRVPFGDDEQAALRRAAQIRRELEVKAYGRTVALNWSKALAVLSGEGR